MASNESETGMPARKGKASLRATEAGFRITDSPASRQEKKQDGGGPRRSAASAPESLSFADAVERRQADIVCLDCDEEGDEEEESKLEREEVVDKRQESGEGGEGLPPRAPKKRLHWPPKGSKTWSTGQRVRILTLAGQKQIWAMHYKGDAAALKERNRSFELACQSGADRVTFEGKSDHQIRTQFNDLLKRKRGNDTEEGPSASGSSPPAIDDEYKALDKAAGAVVDAISVAQLVIKKEKEAFEKVEEDNQARVNFSRNKGMQNCKPGPFSTAFPSPPLRAGRGGGTRPSGGGSSGATGASGCGSSRKVKPMDADITSKMEAFVDGGNIVWDDDDIIAFSKATGRDLKLFFEDGWTGNDLEWDMALSLMTYALHVFTGSFPGGQAEWDEELNGPWNEVDFPGMKPDAMDTLCSYFGANIDDLKARTTGTAIQLYTGGWRGEQLSSDEVLYLHETFAEMLLDGETYELEPDPVTEAGGSSYNGGSNKRFRAGKSKCGRKTRESQNAPREFGVNGDIAAMAATLAAEMKEHRHAEHQHRVAKEAAAQRRWEQEQETRKQDRIDDERLRRELADEKARVRKEERDADREERRAAAAEAKEVRDHEYRMLLLQMQKSSAGN